MRPKRALSKSVTINTEEDLANLVMQAPRQLSPKEEKIDSVVPKEEAQDHALEQRLAVGTAEFQRGFSVAAAGDVSSRDVFAEFSAL